MTVPRPGSPQGIRGKGGERGQPSYTWQHCMSWSEDSQPALPHTLRRGSEQRSGPMLYLGVGDSGERSTGGPGRKLAGMKLGLRAWPSGSAPDCCCGSGSWVGTGMLPLQPSPYPCVWGHDLSSSSFWSHCCQPATAPRQGRDTPPVSRAPALGIHPPLTARTPFPIPLVAPSVAPPSSCSGPACVQHTSPGPRSHPAQLE